MGVVSGGVQARPVLSCIRYLVNGFGVILWGHLLYTWSMNLPGLFLCLYIIDDILGDSLTPIWVQAKVHHWQTTTLGWTQGLQKVHSLTEHSGCSVVGFTATLYQSNPKTR